MDINPFWAKCKTLSFPLHFLIVNNKNYWMENLTQICPSEKGEILDNFIYILQGSDRYHIDRQGIM